MSAAPTAVREFHASRAAPPKTTPEVQAVKRVAGKIAHDINNVLTSILNNAQLLGLTLPESMMEEREEAADIESAARKGAELVLKLRELAHAEPRAHSATSNGASGTILLVDDEEAPRRATRRILEHQGYRVIEAADGREAMSVLEARRHEIDLVISDLMMPNMGGGALFAATHEWEAPPRVLFVSGYHRGDDVPSDGLEVEDVPLLSKPWSIEELVGAVSEALETPAGAPAVHATASDGRS